MRRGKRSRENLPKCVKFDSDVKFIRRRPNLHLFDTNGGISTHLFKFTRASFVNLIKLNVAKINSNLPNFTGSVGQI